MAAVGLLSVGAVLLATGTMLLGQVPAARTPAPGTSASPAATG
ncbi:hypothetical protein ACSNO4_05195 [Kocuria flava]